MASIKFNSIGDTYFKVQLIDLSTEYAGSTRTVYWELTSSETTNYEVYGTCELTNGKLTSPIVTITKLTPSTEYFVRAVVYNKDNHSYDSGQPLATIETTQSTDSVSDIIISIENTLVTIENYDENHYRYYVRMYKTRTQANNNTNPIVDNVFLSNQYELSNFESSLSEGTYYVRVYRPDVGALSNICTVYLDDISDTFSISITNKILTISGYDSNYGYICYIYTDENEANNRSENYDKEIGLSPGEFEINLTGYGYYNGSPYEEVGTYYVVVLCRERNEWSNICTFTIEETTFKISLYRIYNDSIEVCVESGLLEDNNPDIGRGSITPYAIWIKEDGDTANISYSSYYLSESATTVATVYMDSLIGGEVYEVYLDMYLGSGSYQVSNHIQVYIPSQFEWTDKIPKEDFNLTAREWNNLTSNIRKLWVNRKNGWSDHGYDTCSKIAYKGQPFTADMFNEARKCINSLAGEIKTDYVPERGDPVTAKCLNDLAAALTELL